MKRILLLIIWFLVIFNFTFAWSVWHIMDGGQRISKCFSTFIINVASAPSKFYHEIFDSVSPTFIKNETNKEGLTILKSTNINTLNYILVSSINKINNLSEVQLFDLNKNKVVKSWQANLNKIDISNFSKKNIRIIHPILFKGNIVCQINNRLVLLNTDSKNITWQTKNLFHHSIELDANNTLWACGSFPEKESKKVIKDYFTDDAIFQLDPNNGKILFSKSIFDALTENGYAYLFNTSGIVEKDPIHVNDIQPALKDGKFWKKGDLLISLRHKSTVFLYRPSTNKVLWLKTGPWLNQHDCDFLNDHQIGVFGNDVVRVIHKNLLINNINNQYIFDFETDKITTPYTKMFVDGKIGTLTEGRSRILPNGDLYVEETNHGRILFGNTQGLYATFVSRLDKDHIAMLGWSRYYTKEELKEALRK